MFERRLKIILWIICLGAMVMMLRAGTIQIVQRDAWTAAAAKLLTQHQLLDTTRGRILDCRGREMAVDAPCMDVAVDYPAITEDWDQYPKWLNDHAVAACERRLGKTFTKPDFKANKSMIADESRHVRRQVQEMWKTLADLSGQTPDQIDDIRRAIIQRVEIRRQYVLWQNYQKALTAQRAAPPAWYARWWPESADGQGPQLDDCAVDVAEQNQAHVILSAIDTAAYNELAKNAEDLPGLVLRPGVRRAYPFGPIACHLVGGMAAVSARQMESDPNKDDALRKYWPNDLAGQSGAEAMYEPILRGARGEQIIVSGAEDSTSAIDPIPGRDVTLSVDMKLQAEIEDAFAKRREFGASGEMVRQNQPGAAVVIDVPTGAVRALVSYPLFDPNTLAANYAKLAVDDKNQPLLDRAVGASYEPGSTVKPLMALSALTDGVITPRTTIACDGYLYIGGHRYSTGRCWTMSEFGLTHKEVPSTDPMPTDQLTVIDAVERSCNVFFENVAIRMGIVRQRAWYDRFGLGRPTGIGLPEVAGHIPNPANIPPSLILDSTLRAGTGQGSVSATPIQMANAVATIARGGIWMRPRLSADSGPPSPAVNLGLTPEALATVKEAMIRVVTRPAGTGKLPHDGDPDAVDRLQVAAKTGTAQASRLTIPLRDDSGHIVMENGREKRVLVDPADPEVKTWYMGGDAQDSKYAHQWYIGYAPADHPKIAFAVFVEYGGSGGPVANTLVHDVLAACIEQGYLPDNK